MVGAVGTEARYILKENTTCLGVRLDGGWRKSKVNLQVGR